MKKIFLFFLAIVAWLLAYCGSGINQDESPASEKEEKGAHEENHEPDHTVLTMKRQKFAFIVTTGGSIITSGKDVEIIAARSQGIVHFVDNAMLPGVEVDNRQPLFTISGRQLADDNADLRFTNIKADLEKAETNYKRALSLIYDHLITQENFLETKNEYEKILNEYNNLKNTFGDSGNIVSSISSGYIREIFVKEGQIVNTGDKLASVITAKNFILRADLSPDYLDLLPSIEKANFKVGYNNKIFKTSEMNGEKISYGKGSATNSFYIPVYFRIDYDPGLIDGTFAEVFLIGKEKDDVLIVPNSSLMEEFGKIYVFVEDEEGEFIKRYITTGSGNGEFTEVIDGLLDNETIVATGAYNIKLAQTSATIPGHTHNH